MQDWGCGYGENGGMYTPAGENRGWKHTLHTPSKAVFRGGAEEETGSETPAWSHFL